MGLDFVVLMNDGDDAWPGDLLDSRRADDDSELVMERLREIYASDHSPEALARSATFEGWTPFPGISDVRSLISFPFRALIGWPIARLMDRKRLRDDARRPQLSFDEWRATLVNQDPPPVIVNFGPNCPPDGVPAVPAVVQWYGFRGRCAQMDVNPLAEWWNDHGGQDVTMHMFSSDRYEDGPCTLTPESARDYDSDVVTIGDMKVLFQTAADDVTAAFPDIAAAVDADDLDASFGPDPDRGLEREAIAFDLYALRGAARFFGFWQGKGFRIAADY